MSRRITTYESEAAAGLRADALEQLNDFFPKLGGVHLGLTRDDQSVGVAARIESTAPYPEDEVIFIS